MLCNNLELYIYQLSSEVSEITITRELSSENKSLGTNVTNQTIEHTQRVTQTANAGFVQAQEINRTLSNCL